MAIKNVLPLIVLIFSTSVMGQSLKKIYKSKNYEQYVKTFQRKHRDFRRARGVEKIFYADSLYRVDKPVRSNKIYNYVLKRFYSKELRAFRRKSKDTYNKNFIYILHKVAQNHLKSYMLHPNPKSKTARKFERAYKTYYSRLEDLDQADEDILDQLDEDYEDYKDDTIKRKYQWKYFLEAGIYAYKTGPVLVNNTTNARTQLLSSTLSTLMGGGVRYENSRRAYFAGVKILGGSATVQSQESTVTYLQKDAAVSATVLELGHLFKFAKGAAELGPSLSMIMMKGDFEEPNGFTVEDRDIVSLGFNIESNYNFGENWGLGLRIGDALDFESGTWQFTLRYRL